MKRLCTVIVFCAVGVLWGCNQITGIDELSFIDDAGADGGDGQSDTETDSDTDTDTNSDAERDPS